MQLQTILYFSLCVESTRGHLGTFLLFIDIHIRSQHHDITSHLRLMQLNKHQAAGSTLFYWRYIIFYSCSNSKYLPETLCAATDKHKPHKHGAAVWSAQQMCEYLVWNAQYTCGVCMQSPCLRRALSPSSCSELFGAPSLSTWHLLLIVVRNTLSMWVIGSPNYRIWTQTRAWGPSQRARRDQTRRGVQHIPGCTIPRRLSLESLNPWCFW